MSALRAAVREVVGLFVADWWQTLVIVLILAAGWGLAVASHSALAGEALLVLLGTQLVYFSAADARRRRRT